MAIGKTITVSTWTENNKTTKSTAKIVEQVVVDNNLVPDFRTVNPGVIIPLTFYSSGLI